MKTIYIGFSRHKGNAIGSELIQKYMMTDFSHTYFKFKEPRYYDATIFHSVGKGLSYISETNFKKYNVIATEFSVEISDELYDELLQDCHNNAGVKYGFLQNLGILIVETLNKLGCSIKKNPINDGINCSEWLYYILEDIYPKWTDIDPNLVTPKQVYEFLKDKNG